MSKLVVLDTSAFLSLGNLADYNYQKATQISKIIANQESTVIVPSDVFTEIANVVGRKISHKAAVMQSQKILSSEMFTIIESSNDIRLSALDMFKKQSESVSFTDCVVMAVADYYETKDIFGFDGIFKKNGYKIPT